jgi:hypothetical protein
MPIIARVSAGLTGATTIYAPHARDTDRAPASVSIQH